MLDPVHTVIRPKRLLLTHTPFSQTQLPHASCYLSDAAVIHFLFISWHVLHLSVFHDGLMLSSLSRPTQPGSQIWWAVWAVHLSRNLRPSQPPPEPLPPLPSPPPPRPRPPLCLCRVSIWVRVSESEYMSERWVSEWVFSLKSSPHCTWWTPSNYHWPVVITS